MMTVIVLALSVGGTSVSAEALNNKGDSDSVFELTPVDQVLFQQEAPARLTPTESKPEPEEQSSATPPVEQPPAPAATPPTPPTTASETASPATDAVAAPLTAEEVQARRTQAEQLTDVAEDVKAQIVKHYQQAADALKLIADSAKRTIELKAEREKGPALLAEARVELAKPIPKADPDVPAETTLAALDQMRLADEERAIETRKALEAWEARAKVRAERKPQMPALIEKTKQQLAEAVKTLEAPALEGELPAMGLARRTDQEAHVMLLQQQLEQYRAEQLRYDALGELFPLQRDRLTRSKNFYDKRGELWKTVIASARRVESERQAREAREKLRNTHPALRELAERNAALTLHRKELQGDLNEITTTLTESNNTLEELNHDFANITEKESRAGLTTGIGMLLRNQRNHLPSPLKYREQQKWAEAQIVRYQVEQMPLEDERDDLADLQQSVDKALEGVVHSASVSDDEIREMTSQLLEDRRKYLDDLINDYDTCLKSLGEVDVTSRSLIETVKEYEEYIDERVLWIRSAGVVDLATVRRAMAGSRQVFSLDNWSLLASRLVTDIKNNSLLYGMAALAACAILALSRSIRLMIAKLGMQRRQKQLVSVPATLGALALTVIVASAWPALLWLVGWRLASENTDDFTVAVGLALTVTAVVSWSVEVFRQICRSKGIATTFLDWPATMNRNLHSNLAVLMIAGLPLVFLVVVADLLNEGTWADSLGRAGFVAFCLLSTIMLRRILNPNGHVLGDLLRVSRDGWMYRTRHLWYPLTLAAPVALGVLALLGYQYTAEQLFVRLQWTFWLSIVLVIAYTMVMQWMLAARRQLAIEQARARRAAAVAAAQQEPSESTAASSPLPPVEEPRVDLSLLNQQMLQLVRVSACVLFLSGSWLIWSQVLPAMQIVNRVELWTTTEMVTLPYESLNGETELREVPQSRPITLGSLMLALSFLGIAILASRNLPGLLELSILQRLPLDHGGRYAVTTLCRYSLALAGIVLACDSLGVGWSSVQWLVAALTVGLGFGLQEIFANFVSGLIILFERPIRIGDVVTIEGVTGSVSRIQIRATTITDWDRKEYIVPNKEFVTGRLLNWTLSDKTNRVVLNIGVAYGTDTDRALELLLQVAKDHPLILVEPAPISTFEGFGDSCLNLVLRCYLPNLDNRLKVITDIHGTINQKFNKAGIEIAFPQRDLHIRSVTPQLALMTNPDESDSEQAA